MLLSVVVYKHKLTPGQWLGAAVVFAGISVEAFVKRKGMCADVIVAHQAEEECRCSCKTSYSGKGKGKNQILVAHNNRMCLKSLYMGYEQMTTEQ